MSTAWFRRWGWIYRPISWQGVAVLLLTLAFCVNVFVAIDRSSHSVTDTLYGVFPYIVCSFGVLNWIADRSSGSSHRRA